MVTTIIIGLIPIIPFGVPRLPFRTWGIPTAYWVSFQTDEPYLCYRGLVSLFQIFTI